MRFPVLGMQAKADVREPEMYRTEGILDEALRLSPRDVGTGSTNTTDPF